MGVKLGQNEKEGEKGSDMSMKVSEDGSQKHADQVCQDEIDESNDPVSPLVPPLLKRRVVLLERRFGPPLCNDLGDGYGRRATRWWWGSAVLSFERE
jgi:hypothetical protein